MKTLLTFAATLAVTLSAVPLALAGGGKGGSGQSGHGSHGSYHQQGAHYTLSSHYSSQYSSHYSHYKTSHYHNYHLTYGKKFSNGYYYPGKYHKHWSYCCFSKKCGCYCYWCPCTLCWYYYCVPDCCYYPVCYVPYNCFCWGTPVAYWAVSVPPADVPLPEPVETLSPDAQ
jgi:hypothetical protein